MFAVVLGLAMVAFGVWAYRDTGRFMAAFLGVVGVVFVARGTFQLRRRVQFPEVRA